MKLIVGLGNIGDEYKDTRHNVGFTVVDALGGGSKWASDKKLEVEMIKNGDVVFIKPQTYMNESGRAVRKVMDFYKMKIEDVWVIHDDLDIRFGEYKVQKGIGPKVHNGVSSVEDYLGSKNFFRVRIGVDSREERGQMSGSDYVLQKLSAQEKIVLSEIVKKVVADLVVALGLGENLYDKHND